jgi:hypothetical protein
MQEHPETGMSAYNLACVLACQGKKGQSLTFLREAVEHGLQPVGLLELETSDDLKSLRGDPRTSRLANKRCSILRRDA